MRFLFDASITLAVALAVCSENSMDKWIASGDYALQYPTLTPTSDPTTAAILQYDNDSHFIKPDTASDYTPSSTPSSTPTSLYDDDGVYYDDDGAFERNIFIIFFLNMPGSILLSLL